MRLFSEDRVEGVRGLRASVLASTRVLQLLWCPWDGLFASKPRAPSYREECESQPSSGESWAPSSIIVHPESTILLAIGLIRMCRMHVWSTNSNPSVSGREWWCNLHAGNGGAIYTQVMVVGLVDVVFRWCWCFWLMSFFAYLFKMIIKHMFNTYFKKCVKHA